MDNQIPAKLRSSQVPGPQADGNSTLSSTAITKIGTSLTTASSSQFAAINETIKAAQTTFESEIERSSLKLMNANADSKTAIKGFFITSENAIKTVLRNHHTRMLRSKNNVQSLLEFHPQKRNKLLQTNVTAYLKSLSRLKHIAEEIVAERLHYHQFLKKISHRIIAEDPTVLEYFHKTVLVYILNSITSLANERMSGGITDQAMNLRALRISFRDTFDPNDEKHPKGSDNIGNQSEGPADKPDMKLELERRIQEMSEYQKKVCSSISSLFVSQIDNLTKEFHTNLLAEAKRNDGVRNSEMEGLVKVLEEIDGNYSPLDRILRASISVFSLSPKSESSNRDPLLPSALTDIDELDRNTDDPKINSEMNKQNEDEDTAVRNMVSIIQSELSNPEKCHKGLNKLIDLLEKKLLGLFDQQLNSHKKEATNNLKTPNAPSLSSLQFKYLNIQSLETLKNQCIADIKLEQRKIVYEIDSRLNSSGSVRGYQIPLVNKRTNNASNQADKSLSISKHLPKIKIQNIRSTKLISKFFLEIHQHYNSALKDYRNLMDRNSKHLNVKELKSQKYKAAVLLAQNFLDEVQSALENSELLVQEISDACIKDFNLKTKIHDYKAKIKESIALFFKVMTGSLEEFQTVLITCSKQADDFFMLKLKKIKTELSQIGHPFQEFLISRKDLILKGDTLLISDNLNGNESTEANKDTEKPVVKLQDQYFFKKRGEGRKILTSLPPISGRVTSPDSQRDAGKVKRSEKQQFGPSKSPATIRDRHRETDGQDEWWKSDSNGLGFIQNYIRASRKETDVPKWALEVDVN